MTLAIQVFFIIAAISAVGALIFWGGYELYWQLIDMPRYRRAHWAEMSALYPNIYKGEFRPQHWQDKLYARLTR